MKKQTTNTQFFYQNGKLVTVNQGNQQRAILRSANIPLAEQPTRSAATLLATDDKGSVLSEQSEEEQEDHRFTAYGYDPGAHLGLSLLNFTGEWFQTATGCYLLGNGYRAYSPRLGRFHSPDSLSPFAQGGINAYCYCEGDPVNHSDPSGHVRVFLPNGQIMKIKGHTAVAAGRWLKPTSLKRTTSLESVVKGAPPPLPRGATNGTAEWLDLPVATSTRPIASVSPNQASPATSQTPSIHLRVSSPDTSSSAPSRDSTPAESRTSSPAPASELPYHVQVRLGSSESSYYSRRSEPSAR